MRRYTMFVVPWSVVAWFWLACSQAKENSVAASGSDRASRDPWNGSAAPTAGAANTEATRPAQPATIDAAANSITIAMPSVAKTSPSTALRCAIEGDPLAAKHVLSLAMSGDGHLYISDDLGFRRYQAVVDSGCKLKLDRSYGRNGLLAPPADKLTAQSLDGTIALRSGGPTWRLASDGSKAIYAFDLLLGVYRIDGNRIAPVCPNIKGVDSIVAIAGKTYLGGGQVRSVNVRSKCATSDGQAGHGTIYSSGETLWFKSTQDAKTIVALDAKGAPTKVSIKSTDSFAPGGFCDASAVTRCADKICVVDNNCKKVEIYNQDGSFAAELKDRLFDRAPYGLPMGVSAGPAGLWLAATYHEADAYEGAVFLVPATEL